MDLKSLLFYRDFYIHDNGNNKCSFKAEIQLDEPIDSAIFEESVTMAMKRYPYYCVTLGEEDGEYYFKENNRPIVIVNSLTSIKLNSEESNGHFISFGYQDDRFAFNVFHGLTDGAGAYEVLKTLLYYYCQQRYGENEDPLNVRLIGDEIKETEWYDPYEDLNIGMPEEPPLPGKAVNILQDVDPDDRISTVHHLSVPEKEFMDFCVEHDSTPGTMIGLLLSRIIDKMYPDSKEDIRFMLCTNDRKFLGAPKTCFNMVGTVPLEYKTEMRDWPLEKQATSFRGMVFAHTYEKSVMRNAINTKMLCESIRQISGDKERRDFAISVISGMVDATCGMISYVGKTEFPNADDHIKDFRSIAEGSAPLGVEIAVANKCLKIDFLQKFKDPRYVVALQDELKSFGIDSELIDSFVLNAPEVDLPWLDVYD